MKLSERIWVWKKKQAVNETRRVIIIRGDTVGEVKSFTC